LGGNGGDEGSSNWLHLGVAIWAPVWVFAVVFVIVDPLAGFVNRVVAVSTTEFPTDLYYVLW
jgi:uncharacterized protein YhhL (DUF1145 family)